MLLTVSFIFYHAGSSLTLNPKEENVVAVNRSSPVDAAVATIISSSCAVVVTLVGKPILNLISKDEDS